MRRILFFVAITIVPFLALAQETASPQDTTIYDVVELPPFALLANCVNAKPANWTRDSVKHCAEIQLLSLLSGNIRYPQEAREKDLQGTVVVSFVVERDGKMSNLALLKDIGGGCGPEAIRVFKALDEAGLHFQPGVQGDKVVRSRMNIPLRFKLTEALPYYINTNGDSIYVELDVPADFQGGMDSLAMFVVNNLDYPKGYKDSCKTGVIEMSLLIRSDGAIKVENQLDFNNLGLDFQWEALRLINRTAGMWKPAKYHLKTVTSSFPVRVVFKANNPACASSNDKFDNAMLLANEGANLLEENKTDEALTKWTAALALDPNNTEILYYRGTTLLNANRREEACADYNRIKKILGFTWFEGVRKVVCGY